MSDSVLATVMEIVREHLPRDTPVSPSSTFNDLGFDSLDAVEVVLDLEEAFPGVDLGSFEVALSATSQAVADEILRRRQ